MALADMLVAQNEMPLVAIMSAISLCFYPWLALGASVGNMHPITYAIPTHRLLNRDAIVATQEVLQYPLGAGAGLFLGRYVPGEEVSLTRLASMFGAVLLSQWVLLSVGWEPERTLPRLARAEAPSAGRGTGS